VDVELAAASRSPGKSRGINSASCFEQQLDVSAVKQNNALRVANRGPAAWRRHRRPSVGCRVVDSAQGGPDGSKEVIFSTLDDDPAVGSTAEE
jgi:hypothetical protein